MAWGNKGPTFSRESDKAGYLLPCYSLLRRAPSPSPPWSPFIPALFASRVSWGLGSRMSGASRAMGITWHCPDPPSTNRAFFDVKSRCRVDAKVRGKIGRMRPTLWLAGS
jgi:hypothetical protein